MLFARVRTPSVVASERLGGEPSEGKQDGSLWGKRGGDGENVGSGEGRDGSDEAGQRRSGEDAKTWGRSTQLRSEHPRGEERMTRLLRRPAVASRLDVDANSRCSNVPFAPTSRRRRLSRRTWGTAPRAHFPTLRPYLLPLPPSFPCFPPLPSLPHLSLSLSVLALLPPSPTPPHSLSFPPLPYTKCSLFDRSPPPPLPPKAPNAAPCAPSASRARRTPRASSIMRLGGWGMRRGRLHLGGEYSSVIGFLALSEVPGVETEGDAATARDEMERCSVEDATRWGCDSTTGSARDDAALRRWAGLDVGDAALRRAAAGTYGGAEQTRRAAARTRAYGSERGGVEAVLLRGRGHVQLHPSASRAMMPYDVYAVENGVFCHMRAGVRRYKRMGEACSQVGAGGSSGGVHAGSFVRERNGVRVGRGKTLVCWARRVVVLGVGIVQQTASGTTLWLARHAAECAMDAARRLPFLSCFSLFLLAFSTFSSSLSFPHSHTPRCDEILGEFGIWPFGGSSESTPSSSKRKPGVAIASGPGGVDMGRESVRGLVAAARVESASSGGGGAGPDEDAGFELVAAVLEVLSKLDSLL
ncbi:hypothetical protein C8R45DRAFT_1156003 [Mycena sanguinolenta]|nr:hypothetical protein C8R45DRAFT_1156003 [Mycena sanguinolenta]